MSRIIFKQTAPPSLISKMLGLGFIFALLGLFFYSYFYTHAILSIQGEKFDARIADTNTRRMRGLSGTSALGKNEAMLFVFNTPSQESFWMKDMNYALDIIWLRDKKIIDIAARVSPGAQKNDSELPLYTPRLPADQVVEVIAGTVDRLNLKIGDTILVEKNN